MVKQLPDSAILTPKASFVSLSAEVVCSFHCFTQNNFSCTISKTTIPPAPILIVYV